LLSGINLKQLKSQEEEIKAVPTASIQFIDEITRIMYHSCEITFNALKRSLSSLFDSNASTLGTKRACS